MSLSQLHSFEKYIIYIWYFYTITSKPYKKWIIYDACDNSEIKIIRTYFKLSYHWRKIYGCGGQLLSCQENRNSKEEMGHTRFDRTFPKVSYSGEVPPINNGTVLHARVHALSYTFVQVTLAIWMEQTSAEWIVSWHPSHNVLWGIKFRMYSLL